MSISRRYRVTPKSMRGMSMIELMIALLLGLLVVGAAIGIFLSNRQTYRATDNLGRIQENARTAFEMMARDVREAGGNACATNIPVANVVNDRTTNWTRNWDEPVRGFENGALAASLAGTDAVQVLSSGAGAATVVTHAPGATEFTLSNNQHGFKTGDVLMVCDPQQLAIFEAGSVSGVSVNHASSANCSNSLGALLPVCSAPVYTFTPNSVMTRLQSSQWYVKANGRGGNSLYRNMSGTEEEVAEGVRDMQITYLMPGAAGVPDQYVSASAITTAAQWAQVRALRFVLSLEGMDRVGTDGNVLQRQLIHVVTLRNRNA